MGAHTRKREKERERRRKGEREKGREIFAREPKEGLLPPSEHG